MSGTPRTVVCGEHGNRSATFVCQHLVSGADQGFHWSGDEDEWYPDAWCDRCDAALREEGEWNDRSKAVAGISLVCDRCYDAARARNWRQDLAAFERLVKDGVSYLESRQAELHERFRLGEYERYDWNQETAELVFSTGGRPIVVARIQFVGSVSTRSGTWLWSWANSSYLEGVRASLRAVRQHGGDRHFLKLASAYWEASEEDGWEMTAVSAFLLRALGAYRSPDEHGFTFMLLTDVRWAH
jgi:uncharacterized protein DUF6882